MGLVSNVPRFGEQVRKLFGAKGAFGLTAPNDALIVLDMLSSLPEMLVIRGERRFAIVNGVAASVGNVNVFRYTNAAGSGKLIIFESIVNLGPDIITAGPDATDTVGGGLPGNLNLDSRHYPAPPALTQQALTLAASPLAQNHFRLVATNNVYTPLNVVLAPVGSGSTNASHSYSVVQSTVNTAMSFGIVWRERDATAEELEAT